MGSFGKTALSGQISGFSSQGKMGSFGNFSFWAFRGWIFSFSFSIFMFLSTLLNGRQDAGDPVKIPVCFNTTLKGSKSPRANP
jgi:hypothetical protein